MSDVLGIYVIVILVGFEQGWITLKFCLAVTYRFTRRPIAWNTSLAVLIVLTFGLSAVIYAVTKQEPTLGGPYAYLPASLLASSFAGSLGCHGWGLYRATACKERR